MTTRRSVSAGSIQPRAQTKRFFRARLTDVFSSLWLLPRIVQYLQRMPDHTCFTCANHSITNCSVYYFSAAQKSASVNKHVILAMENWPWIDSLPHMNNSRSICFEAFVCSKTFFSLFYPFKCVSHNTKIQETFQLYFNSYLWHTVVRFSIYERNNCYCHINTLANQLSVLGIVFIIVWLIPAKTLKCRWNLRQKNIDGRTHTGIRIFNRLLA